MALWRSLGKCAGCLSGAWDKIAGDCLKQDLDGFR